ncbi:MAG: GSCFA domain-containing protein [Bacteroidaceae bacterium]|nr:GSCFA domain-containing protein [Bacteroidaceae bacterium]
MQLTTVIDIPKSKFKISADDKVLFLGSCFADSVGEKFVRGGFDVLVNPFGTLYNPMSIAELLLRCVDEASDIDASADIFQSEDGIWHSWMHHSRFSSPNRDELISNINEAYSLVRNFLATGNVLVITFGTSIIYRHKHDGRLVANCHKQLDTLFTRERLSVESIVDKWKQVIDKLHSVNNNLKIIFTVSPIRHKRDGMHINNISKGILLQSVDEIINTCNLSTDVNNPIDNPVNRVDNPIKSVDSSVDNANAINISDNVISKKNRVINTTVDNSIPQYFPSYEIMLDELRDYRFYADDMIHPSPLAVEYIWQRFQDTYFDRNTQEHIRLKNKEWARSQHREIVKT